MITPELIFYLKKEIKKGLSKDLIISKLIDVGWHMEDIKEGFLSVELESNPQTSIEVEKKEIIQAEIPIVKIPPKPVIKNEGSKIWVPMSVPIKEQKPVIEKNNQKLDAINPKYLTKKEDLIPNLIPKKTMNSFGSVNKEVLIPTDDLITKQETLKDSIMNSLPKRAMISSYESDLELVNKTKKEIVKKKSNFKIKWVIIPFITILILSLIIWVFTSGYVNIKSFNIFSIKKDPKVLLLNNSKVLSSLQSYKTETNVEISLPSFANITSGLMSGNTISSADKDNISVNTLGVINQNEKELLSDNFITIKSSMLDKYITADVKNDGSNLFISTPSINQIIKENTIESPVIKINKEQIGLISSLFSPEIEAQLNKINIYKILSNEMPSYINTKTLNAYNELINNVDIIEKAQEKIKGIDTYHYSINPDKQMVRSFLNDISGNFVLNLSDNDKERLSEILGAVTVDSFDVWIGKDDNNIYQYSLVLSVPLSKVVNLEDKSIGDNLISVNWKTTYYDFDISNNIFMPDKSILVTDFVNSTKEAKLKNKISSFVQLADNLFKVEKAYGSKINSKGDCMNPTTGSLFSPTGHTKSSITAISSISGLLNDILETTNNIGYCYSTPKAWSFTIPIPVNYEPTASTESKYFFCVDNTGLTKELIAPPDGVICK